jgi:Dyp-type peroxidase family
VPNKASILSEIQGNVWPGFKKPEARFVFLRFDDTRKTREWLRSVLSRITTAEQMIPYLRDESKAWLNCSVTAEGLNLLAPDLYSEILVKFSSFEPICALVTGGVQRSIDLLGDTSFEQTLIGRVDSPPHFVVDIEGDHSNNVDDLTDSLLAVARKYGCTEELVLSGTAIMGRDGHQQEHFGFRDGVSQPKPKTLDPDGDVEPGEFILGLPREHRENDAAPWSDLPKWTDLGSFQVFRKLQQDVDGWHKQAEAVSKTFSISPNDAEAQMVGRTKEGATAPFPQDFAHVRKMRSGDNLHRIIRRGIPYENKDKEKGLLFNAFMANIVSQFEFLQKTWANNPDLPTMGCGIDPVIGCPAHSQVKWERDGYLRTAHRISNFVKTRGCVYAFVPSLTTLTAWAKD